MGSDYRQPDYDTGDAFLDLEAALDEFQDETGIPDAELADLLSDAAVARNRRLPPMPDFGSPGMS